eukprot:scaffold4205_cov105-Isochrysis_galbana.AAC.1
MRPPRPARPTPCLALPLLGRGAAPSRAASAPWPAGATPVSPPLSSRPRLALSRPQAAQRSMDPPGHRHGLPPPSPVGRGRWPPRLRVGMAAPTAKPCG